MRDSRLNMGRFAFILHYPNLDKGLGMLLGRQFKAPSYIPPHIIKRLFLAIPPYRWTQLCGLTSATGQQVSGDIIVCPFLPEHILTAREETILHKLVQAGRLAERLGAQVIGLAGFASIVGNGGEELAKMLRLPVTSGNTYTAALVIEGIRKAAHLMKMDLKQSTLAIIGATGDIGSVCTKIFAGEVAYLNLAARSEPQLQNFARSLRSRAQVTVTKYVQDAVRNADIILTATSSMATLIEADDVKAGAILCDVAIPHNIAADIVRRRPDVFAFEGGLAKLPAPIMLNSQKWRHLSPDGMTMFGCLAETVLLALEERWESFSLGRGKITPDRIHEILGIADRHGFGLANFRYNGSIFGNGELQQLQRHAEARRKTLRVKIATI